MSDEFKGFARPTKNYFPMPNEWIDICAGIKSLAELKVVQYIIRHTWGYKEYDGTPKTITTDEFMHGRKRTDGSRIDKGTGLSNRSVIDGLRDAEKHGYLVKDVDDADKARINKSYALKMVEAIPDVKMLHTSDVNNLHTGIRCEETSQPVCNPFTSTVKNVHSGYEETSQRSEKYTLERHLKKDTLERQERALTPLDFLPEETHENDAQVSRPAAAHDPLPGSSVDTHAFVGAAPDVEEDIPTAHRLPVIKIGATNGNSPAYPANRYPALDRVASAPDQGTTVVSASRPGEPDSPPALSRHSSVSLNDGAATGSSSEPRPSGKRRGKKVTQEPEPIPQEALRILDDWDSLHKKPVLRSDANIQAAKLLVQAQTNREEMKGCRDWLPTTDRPGKPWYRRIGVHLPDIAAKLEQYRSLQDMPLADKRNDVTTAQWEAALQAEPRIDDGERHSDFDIYVGNGPEERKRWREEGDRLKALGFCPDL